MPELIHKVSTKEWYRAERQWYRLYNQGHRSFWTFIGTNDFHSDDLGYSDIDCSETAYRKIQMLNSPHAYALMKAFIVRTGYHKKLPEK